MLKSPLITTALLLFFALNGNAQSVDSTKDAKAAFIDSVSPANKGLQFKPLSKNSTAGKLSINLNNDTVPKKKVQSNLIDRTIGATLDSKEQQKGALDREKIISQIHAKTIKNRIDTTKKKIAPVFPKTKTDTLPNLDKTDRYVIIRIENSIQIKFTTKSTATANTFFQEFAKLFPLTANDKFELVKSEKDNIGFTHYRYQQYYKGISVMGGQYLLHEKNGKLVSANGDFYNNLSVATLATLSKENAIQAAIKLIGAKVYKWQLPEEENFLKKETNNVSATYFPKPTLIVAAKNGIYEKDNFRLCYKMTINAAEPYLIYDVFIDANTGEFVNKISKIMDGEPLIKSKDSTTIFNEKKNSTSNNTNEKEGQNFSLYPLSSLKEINGGISPTMDVSSTANTLYSGVQTITTDSYNGYYRLRETARPIQTFNMQNGTSYSNAVDFINTTNNWTTQNIYLDKVTISSVNNNWEDVLGEQIANGGKPDMFIEIRDASNKIIWSKADAYFENIFPPITISTGKLILSNGPYVLNIYDYDVTSSNDLLGSFSFTAVAGNATFSANGTAGSIARAVLGNPALDAHWGMEKTYDFYLSQLSRNSFDGAGSLIKNYVHPDLIGMGYPDNDNAFWNGYEMTYGDGTSLFSPVTSIDVVGHEFTHAVVQHTANLYYQNESGALNESFADIFGTAIEFYGATSPNWTMGESCTIQSPFFLRSMSNPNGSYKSQPDTYNGQYWAHLIPSSYPTEPPTTTNDKGGVHTNSGVQNYWFYLLSQGGSGTNDINNTFSVTGIGVTKATKIAYQNLAYHLSPTSNYLSAYNNSLLAVEELYPSIGGIHSQEYNSVRQAWYAVGIGNDPNKYCSGTTNLTAPSGTFSDGSGNASYGPNANCKWVIAPEGANKITLNFSKFRTEAMFDSVLVYDGPDETYPLLTTWWGNTLPPTSISSGGAMCIRFTSDAYATDSGWVANYTSTGVVPSCSGQNLLKASTGNFSDGSGTSNYSNNQFCSWLIAPPCATSVTLSFSQFNTEAGYDGVVVYNGNSSSAPLLGAFSGTSLPASVTANSGQMYVVFVSDFANVRAGFAASYTSTGAAGCAGTTTLNTLDYGVISDGSGANNYCNNQDCNWLIQPPQATSVTLNFASFNLEPGSSDGNSIYDAVEVYDGTTTNSPLLGRFSGNSLPPSVTASSGSMLVRFYSDIAITDSGWSAYYTSTSAPHCTVNNTLTASAGTITDGSSTSLYANNSDCSWLIQPPGATKIKLSFTQFDTEQDYDGVIVYDGQNNAAPVLGIFSGAAIPAAITSTGGSMFVQFLSDEALRKAGFSANYNSLNTIVFNPFADTIKVCGDTLVLDATSFYTAYNWNTGATTSSLNVTHSGFYKVTVTDAFGQTASDSTYVAILNATIPEQDTTICKSASISLSVKTPFSKNFTFLAKYLDSSYYVSNQQYSWFEGRDYSVSLGGHLATFNTIKEDTLVSNKIKRLTTINSYPLSLAKNSGECYIGLFQNKSSINYSEPAGGWQWITGEPLTYTNWSPTEPNNNSVMSEYATTNWNNSAKWNDIGPGTITGTNGIHQFVVELYKSPYSILWSTGDTTENITVSPTKTTTYYVTVRDRLTSCMDSVTVTVGGISSFNPLQDTTKACGDSTILNAGSGFATYSWSNGANTQSIAVKQMGKYSVTVTNASGCSATDSSFVSIINANIFNNDTAICKGSTIKLSLDSSKLTNYAIGASGPSGGLIIYDKGVTSAGWRYLECASSDASGGIGWWNGTLITTGASSTAIGSGFQNTSTVISSQGAGNYAAVAAKNYTQSGYTDWFLPSKDELNLMYQNLKSKGLGNLNSDFYWSSSEFNVNAAYRQVFSNQGVSDAGWKNFTNGAVRSVRYFASDKLKVKWSTGDTTNFITVSPTQTTKYYCTISNEFSSCIDSVTVTIGQPDTSLAVLDPQQICSNTGSVRMRAGVASSYKWLKDGVVIPDATASLYTALQTGSYRAVVFNSIGCSDTSRSVAVIINPLPSGSVRAPISTNICSGSSILLTATGGATYQWHLNGNAISGATSDTYSASLAGIYTATLISAANCSAPATGSISLTLVTKPTAAFSYLNNCVNVPVVFSNGSTISQSGVVTYTWSFGNGAKSVQSIPSPQTYSAVGNYLVKLVIVPTACPLLSDSVSKTIDIVPLPTGIRYPAINVLKNVDSKLQARNIGISYSWLPLTGLSNPLVSNPSFNYSVGADYRINIINSAGCNIVDSVLIRVFEKTGVYVPKAFAPNGNGSNELLRPILVLIPTINYFRVYNRWGQLIYQTKNIGEGWNGTFKGVTQPIETYTWTFEGVDYNGVIIRETGKSTLIR